MLELQVTYGGSGATLYAVVRRSSDLYAWNTATGAFEAFVNASIGNYAVALADQGGDTYAANFPAAIVDGQYRVSYYVQSGGSPSTADLILKTRTVVRGVNAATSVYAAQSDIEDIFGTQNVLIWSDLQNTGDVDEDRVARGLAYADNEINLFFADGPFVVPLTGHYTATMTRKWAATLAGIWLYENRGTRDDDKEGHHYTVRRAGIVSEMATFKSGTLRLDAPRRWPSPSAPAAV